jgi:DNA-binding LytR/AlgR family response regulator
VTSGAQGGASGRRELPSWLISYLVIAALTIPIAAINTLSILDERGWQNRPLEWWRPAVWEGSSGLMIVALAWVPLLAIRAWPLSPGRRLPRLGLHLMASAAFSLAHVGAMVLLRHAAYALAGDEYHFAGGLEALIYEYRKDLLTYSVYAGLFWFVDRLRQPPPQPAAPVPEQAEFVIDEGHRLLKVQLGEILCVRSSGNYAEFWLTDGRRPLMRSTLAGLTASLEKAGFVRTHRCWLVNSAHVVEIAAAGSGDCRLRLSGGEEVPLSRRHRSTLMPAAGLR